MVVSTRSMAALTEDTKAYLQQLIGPLVTKANIDELEKKILTEISGRLDEHEKRIATLEDAVSSLREQIYSMETMQSESNKLIGDSQNDCYGLIKDIKVASKKIDHLENYSRRPSLRLCGIKTKEDETKDDIKGTIFQCFDDMDVNIPIERIYRFHR